MKIKLPDALHARPANLLVRAARKLDTAVYVHKGDRRADAREILQVLSLRAAKGDEVQLSSDSPHAIEALAELMESFDPDLVPEMGLAAAAGVAIGEAVVLDDIEVETHVVDDELARTKRAFDVARRELAEVVATLADHEKQLFEPELPILDSLEPLVLHRVAHGENAVDAIRAETHGPSDLVDDARARLVAALTGSGWAQVHRALSEREDRELVLVTRELTPTLIARLPSHVVGVIAVLEDMTEVHHAPSAAGTTSHAAILARGRSLPLIYVPEDVAATLVDGSLTVIDTTGGAARVWGDPSATLIADAKARRDTLAAEALAARNAALAAQAIVTIRANVGAVNDDVPEAAAGIGLVRTELVFAAKSGAPREEEQVAAYRAIARKTRGPVYIRLFDAGGDKHLAFLAARDDERGIALLLANDEVLRTQLRAIGRARDAGDVRVLIPLVRGPEDVHAVRARAPEGLLVGAMVETAHAARTAEAIAESADFVCIGTNDLAADVLGASREAAPNGLDPRVLQAIVRTVEGAHAAHRTVTVCGELAADPRGARVLVGLGVDALSVAASRVPDVTLDLATVSREDCLAAAVAAMSP